MLNQIILESGVVKNEGLKYSSKGKAFLNLVLVFKTLEKKADGWGDKKNYIRGTMWGKMAQGLSDKLKPGNSIIIKGKLNQKNWVRENGKQAKDYSLVIDEIHFAKRKRVKIQA